MIDLESVCRGDTRPNWTTRVLTRYHTFRLGLRTRRAGFEIGTKSLHFISHRFDLFRLERLHSHLVIFSEGLVECFLSSVGEMFHEETVSFFVVRHSLKTRIRE